MSLQILNAENGENGGSIKDDLTEEDCGFFFAPPEPTGRPSILRPSQKENLPPKSVGKAMKVNFWFCITFILSPSMVFAAECMCCLVLEEYRAHVFPFSLPPTPFLKVTFQTPQRDPHTRKLLSPAMTDKLQTAFALDDCRGDVADNVFYAPSDAE